MSDSFKSFFFDLQRFDEVSYAAIGESSILSSKYAIKGSGSSIYSSMPEASLVSEQYFWGSTKLIDATFGTASGAFLNVEYDTINFTLSGIEDDIDTPDFDESTLNGETYSYYSIKDVTAIDFKNSYTIGGTTSTVAVTSNSAVFNNLSSSAGTINITSEIPLALSGVALGDTEANYIFSGPSVALEQFVVNTNSSLVTGITLNNGSLSAYYLPENINVVIDLGDMKVDSIVGASATVVLNGQSALFSADSIADKVNITVTNGSLSVAKTIGADANINLGEDLTVGESIGSNAVINIETGSIKVTNLGASATVVLNGQSATFSAESIDENAKITMLYGGLSGRESCFKRRFERRRVHWQ